MQKIDLKKSSQLAKKNRLIPFYKKSKLISPTLKARFVELQQKGFDNWQAYRQLVWENPLIRAHILKVPENERSILKKILFYDTNPLGVIHLEETNALKSAKCVPVLLQFALIENPSLTGLSLEALINLRAVQTAPVVAKFLKSKNLSIRAEAIRVLAEFNYTKAIPEIQKQLACKDSVVVFSAMHALAKFNSIESLDLIKKISEKTKNPFLLKRAQEFFAGDTKQLEFYFERPTLLNSNKIFARKMHEKDNAFDTLVLGGRFAKKAFYRVMPKSNFDLWLNAFQAKEVWQKLGFDYNPIEPILMKKNIPRAKQIKTWKTSAGEKVSIANKPILRIATGFLGENLAGFLEKNENKRIYSKSIRRQMRKISKGLEELNIYHGQASIHNFRIELIEKNHKTIPRIYLVDWDRSQKLDLVQSDLNKIKASLNQQ